MNSVRNILRMVGLAEIPEKDMTDEQIINKTRAYVPDNVSVPMSVLRDAMKGAQTYTSNNSDVSLNDALSRAMQARLAQRNVNRRGVSFSPTGADYFDLWNQDLVVPQKADMSKIW